jgi:hypothetical protein
LVDFAAYVISSEPINMVPDVGTLAALTKEIVVAELEMLPLSVEETAPLTTPPQPPEPQPTPEVKMSEPVEI